MRTVDTDEMDSRLGPAEVTVPLTDALGTTDVAVNYYELAPGESLAYGYHAHENQEELFYVHSGAVTFRTAAGSHRVEAGQLVRFGPGEYQRGVNEDDRRAAVLAVGAPREPGHTDIRRYCGACDAETTQTVESVDDHSAVVVRCGTCESVVDRYE